MRLLVLALPLLLTQPVAAQSPDNGWIKEKCATYAVAWNQALDGWGTGQLNYAFIAGNENFIAGGCTAQADICPRSQDEIAIANALTLALMNSGTASTFLPFRCPLTQDMSGGWTGPGL